MKERDRSKMDKCWTKLTGKKNNDECNNEKKIKLIGHILRYNRFITAIVMKGKINGKRIRRRPSKSFFEEIFQCICIIPYQ